MTAATRLQYFDPLKKMATNPSPPCKKAAQLSVKWTLFLQTSNCINVNGLSSSSQFGRLHDEQVLKSVWDGPTYERNDLRLRTT